MSISLPVEKELESQSTFQDGRSFETAVVSADDTQIDENLHLKLHQLLLADTREQKKEATGEIFRLIEDLLDLHKQAQVQKLNANKDLEINEKRLAEIHEERQQDEAVNAQIQQELFELRAQMDRGVTASDHSRASGSATRSRPVVREVCQRSGGASKSSPFRAVDNRDLFHDMLDNGDASIDRAELICRQAALLKSEAAKELDKYSGECVQLDKEVKDKGKLLQEIAWYRQRLERAQTLSKQMQQQSMKALNSAQVEIAGLRATNERQRVEHKELQAMLEQQRNGEDGQSFMRGFDLAAQEDNVLLRKELNEMSSESTQYHWMNAVHEEVLQLRSELNEMVAQSALDVAAIEDAKRQEFEASRNLQLAEEEVGKWQTELRDQKRTSSLAKDDIKQELDQYRLALVELQKQSESDKQAVSELQQSAFSQVNDGLMKSLAHRQKEVAYLREQVVQSEMEKDDAREELESYRQTMEGLRQEADQDKKITEDVLGQLAVEHAHSEKTQIYLRVVEKERDHFHAQARELQANAGSDKTTDLEATEKVRLLALSERSTNEELNQCRVSLEVLRKKADIDKRVSEEAFAQLAAEKAERDKSKTYLKVVEMERDHFREQSYIREMDADELSNLYLRAVEQTAEVSHSESVANREEVAVLHELHDLEEMVATKKEVDMEEISHYRDMLRALGEEVEIDRKRSGELIGHLEVEKAYGEKSSTYLSVVEKERDHFRAQAKELQAITDADRTVASEATAQLHFEKMQHAKLISDKNAILKQLDQYRAEVEELCKHQDGSKQEITSSLHDSLVKERDQYRAELDELTASFDEINKETDAVFKERDQYRLQRDQDRVELDNLRAALMQIQNENEAKDKQRGRYRSQIDDLTASLCQMRIEKQETSKERDRYCSEVDSLSRRYCSEVDSLEAENQEIGKERDRYRSELDSFFQAIGKERDCYRSEIDALAVSVREIHVENSDIAQERDVYRSELDDLAASVHRIHKEKDAITHEQRTYNAQLKRTEEQKSGVANELDQYRVHIQELRGQVELDKQRLGSLEMQQHELFDEGYRYSKDCNRLETEELLLQAAREKLEASKEMQSQREQIKLLRSELAHNGVKRELTPEPDPGRMDVGLVGFLVDSEMSQYKQELSDQLSSSFRSEVNDALQYYRQSYEQELAEMHREAEHNRAMAEGQVQYYRQEMEQMKRKQNVVVTPRQSSLPNAVATVVVTPMQSTDPNTDLRLEVLRMQVRDLEAKVVVNHQPSQVVHPVPVLTSMKTSPRGSFRRKMQVSVESPRSNKSSLSPRQSSMDKMLQLGQVSPQSVVIRSPRQMSQPILGVSSPKKNLSHVPVLRLSSPVESPRHSPLPSARKQSPFQSLSPRETPRTNDGQVDFAMQAWRSSNFQPVSTRMERPGQPGFHAPTLPVPMVNLRGGMSQEMATDFNTAPLSARVASSPSFTDHIQPRTPRTAR